MAEVIDAALLNISVDADRHYPSLCVTGQANHSNIDRVVAVLDVLADAHERCVSLDLSGLESMDSAAVEGLAGSASTFRDRRKRLRLMHASEPVQDVFDKFLLGGLFCIERECLHKFSPGGCGIACVQWEMDVFTLPAHPTNCQQARARVDKVADAVGLSRSTRGDIMLAVGEAVANAVQHGGDGRPNASFTVTCVATPEKVCVSVSDDGPGFDPSRLPAIDDSRERGRGIHCINAVMDEVAFHFHAGTTIQMVKMAC